MRTTAERLPRELATLIRPQLAPLAEEIVHAIRATIPEYAKPLDGCYGQAIRLGVNQALTQFVDRIADPDRARPDFAEVYRQLGRLEASEGRSLDSLQKAYRLGTRVAWRHLIRFRQRSGLPTAMMWTLGEATLAYADELIALSVEGYADMQARSEQGRQRRRKRLLRLLISEEDTARAEAAELATAARWPLPERLCVVLVDRVGPVEAEPELPAEVLADFQGAAGCLLVPDPDGSDWWPACAEALAGWRVVIGPTTVLADAAKSHRHAQLARDLVRRTTIADTFPVRCADHLSTLWLLTDEFLVEQLIRTRLAPLAPLTDKQHKRLGETLLAWLETRGGAPEIAARLRVHPQTVRYRMRQVERLFGDQLRCPDARFELEVALRAASLTESTAPEQEAQQAG
ncbi:helix-turn-helix domain-containing protein [Kutzneria sp. NPDC052558]|uniref:PucR family transcriptional regulator n=1 Tax=Kutzneria sp. NPDC052558 TaxID=3364121 RepID=UPI0037CA2269